MTGKRVHLWLSVTAALAFGLVLRLWFITHAARIDGDTLIYGDIAKNLLEHGVYGFSVSDAPPHPTLIRLPGYPLFLALCFKFFGMEHYTAVMCVQAAIDLLTCLLLAVLSRQLLGRRAALAVLWLAALCPFTASYVSAPLTETLSLACIALVFFAMERWGAAGRGFNPWLWPISAALSCAILLRPEQVLLAVAVFLGMLGMIGHPIRCPLAQQGKTSSSTCARQAIPVLIAAIFVVLALLPWSVRNWKTFHVLQPLAPRYATDPGEMVPLGFQRWYRTWAIDFASTEDVYWNWNGGDVDISDLPTRAFGSDPEYSRTEALLAEYNRTDNSTRALDARFAALAVERIQADPFSYYIVLPFARLLDMCFRPRTEMLPIDLRWWQWRAHPRQSAIALFMAALNLSYFVLGGYGFWRWRRRGWSGNPALAAAMMASILLRCALLLTLDNSEPRYTLELFPVLLVWSGAIFAGKEISGDPQSSAYRS